MSSKKKRSPEETWSALERASMDDEVDRVASLSEAELDEELRQVGVDPEELREEGVRIARLMKDRARGRRPGLRAGDSADGDLVDAPDSDGPMSANWVSSPPGAVRSMSRRTVWLVAAAITVTVGAGLPFAAGLLKPKPPDTRDLADAGPIGVDAAPVLTAAPPAPDTPQTGSTDRKPSDNGPNVDPSLGAKPRVPSP